MSKGKKAALASASTIILAIIGIFAGSGGDFTFDFSNSNSGNSNTDNSNVDNSQSTIINEGDTIINEIIDEVIDEEALVDYGYDIFCEEIEPESPECDDYWLD